MSVVNYLVAKKFNMLVADHNVVIKHLN